MWTNIRIRARSKQSGVRFREEDYPSGYSDENFTRTIMQFILEDEDNMMINSKIKDVIGQLPVRLTKNKFFECSLTACQFTTAAQRKL